MTVQTVVSSGSHAVLVLVLLLLLAACGPAYRGAPLYGPLAVNDPQVALGQRVFDEYCNQCHPGGASGLGPAINNRPLPRWLMKFQVRNGLGAMPAFSEDEIGDQELDALVAYLLELRQLERRASE